MQLQLVIIFMLFSVVIGGIPEECLEIHALKHAEIEALSPNTPAEEIPDNIKCYAKCLLRDYLGEDDKLSLQRIGDKASAEEKIMLQKCLEKYDNLSTSAPCEYGYLILQCLTLMSKPKSN